MNGRMKFKKFPEEFTPIDETVSTTGKYAIAYGQHFRPEICYDVVGLDRSTGVCIRRHYKDKEECLKFWERFKQDMTAPRGESEEDEKDTYRTFSPN